MGVDVALALVIGLLAGGAIGWIVKPGGMAIAQVHPEPGTVTHSSSIYWLPLRSRQAYYGLTTQNDADGAKSLASESTANDKLVLWEGHPKGVTGSNKIFFDHPFGATTPLGTNLQYKPTSPTSTVSGQDTTLTWRYQGDGGTPQTLELPSGPATTRLFDCLVAVKDVDSVVTSIKVTGGRVYLEFTLPGGYVTSTT